MQNRLNQINPTCNMNKELGEISTKIIVNTSKKF